MRFCNKTQWTNSVSLLLTVGGKKKNPEFFGDARSLGCVVPLDKAFIEQNRSGLVEGIHTGSASEATELSKDG